MIAAALVTFLLAQKADFAVPALAAFDGVRWGDVVFGESTDGTLKRRFTTAKAKARPEAIAIRTDQADTDVEVLLDGRGDKARAAGILVRYERPRFLKDLEGELGVSEPRYLRGRWEDWRVAVFPARGIAAQVLRNDEVIAVFLGAPERLASAVRTLDTEPVPVVRQPDPGEGWDRVVRFGRVTVDMDVKAKNRPAEIANRDLDRIQDDATYDARRARGRGNIAYERGESGTYGLTIRSGDWNDKGKATVSVNANFRGESPYGEVTASAYASDTVGDNYRNRIYRIIEKAMDSLDQDVSNKVRRLGPPPIESQRQETWRLVLAVGAPFRS